MITTINFVPGDTVRVHQKIQEGDKSRIQVFEGVVLAIRGRDENKSFTVQKMVGEIGVERIWQINSPLIEKVDVKAHAKRRVRRAKLDRKSTRLNSSHQIISYAVFCLKKKTLSNKTPHPATI